MDDIKFFNELTEKNKSYNGFVLLTVTSTTGSVPRRVGSKMALFPDGSILGTIGGGTLENEAIKDAHKSFDGKTSFSKTYYLTEKGTGATCGGSAEVFIDYNGSTSGDLLIFGGGHIGLPLSKFASDLDFKVTIADPREEFASRERFPHANKCVHLNLDKMNLSPMISSNTFVVLISHSHEVDFTIVSEVLKTSPHYIGMIGSSKKVKHTFSRLEERGFSKEEISRIYAPIGLDIGAESPAEIALAIMAEIIAVREKKEQPTYCIDKKRSASL